MSAAEIQRALETFVHPGGVVEIRVLKGKRIKENGGYFDNLAKAAETAHMLDQLNEYEGIYFTINRCDPDLLARYNNKMCQTRNPVLTKENNIIHRDWLLVDLDVKSKLSGISSKDSEHEEALAEAVKFMDMLSKEYGWPAAVRADSGNGAHLLYKIDLPNTKESTELIRKTLLALNHIFNHPRLKIDGAPHDPPRICKLYGTMTRKGDELGDRRHRRACLLDVPDSLEVLPEAKLVELVELYEAATGPAEPEPTPMQYSGGIEDMEGWLKDHGLIWTKSKASKNDGTRYILAECPGCHQDGCDVTKYLPPRNGQSASCKHDTCKIKSWEDFRRIVEPEYYEQRKEEWKPPAKIASNNPITLMDLLKDTGKTDEEGKPVLRLSYTYAMSAFLSKMRLAGCSYDGHIWRFDGNIYVPDGELIIKNTLYDVAEDRIEQKSCKEIVTRIHDRLMLAPTAFNPVPWVLGVENGKINLITGEFSAYEWDDYITDKIPVKHDPEATCPEFIKYLESITPYVDDRITLVDWFVALAVRAPLPYVLFLLGLGRNGKGIYERLLKAFFGNTNFRDMGAAELEKNNFAKGYLREMRGCIASEEEGSDGKTVIGTSFIKRTSGAGDVDSDVKNRDRVRFLAFVKFLIDTNKMPRINDTSLGWIERFVKIDLPYSFLGPDEQDPDDPYIKLRDDGILARITAPEELSGILNLVIFRAKALGPDWRIHKRPGREMFDEYQEQSDSFKTFSDKFIEFQADDYEIHVPTDHIYGWYSKWCSAHVAEKVNDKLFGFFMKKFAGSRKKVKRCMVGYTGRKNAYPGVFFDEDACKEDIAKARKKLTDAESPIGPIGVPSKSHRTEEEKHDVATCTSHASHVWRELRDLTCARTPAGAQARTHADLKPKIDGIDGTMGLTATGDGAKSGHARDGIGPYGTSDGTTSIKRPKRKLITLRITADCECDGIQYKRGDVVGVEPEKEKQICGVKIVEFEACVVCHKPMKPYAKSGRGNICKDCFKLGCPQLNGYMHKSMSKGVECKSCGKVIKHSELVSTDGDCEACYYNKLGLSSVGFAEFGCKDGN